MEKLIEKLEKMIDTSEQKMKECGYYEKDYYNGRIDGIRDAIIEILKYGKQTN